MSTMKKRKIVRSKLRIPCPACGERLLGRISVKQKPYFVCDECGIQIFARALIGIKRLTKRSRQLQRRKRASKVAPAIAAKEATSIVTPHPNY